MLPVCSCSLLRDLPLMLSTAQVEDFKQQMSKEVRAMIRDVQRLHGERQAMQNQIADLFSFYSKYENEKGAPPVCVLLGVLVSMLTVRWYFSLDLESSRRHLLLPIR